MLVSQGLNNHMQIDHIAEEFVKQALSKGISNRKDLQVLKNQFSLKYKISSFSSIELLKAYNHLVETDDLEPNAAFEKLIRKRGVRSLSGIASITVITKDYDCPGKCIYCPKEKDMPKSYLSNEPAVMRAILNDFDPYKQVVARLKGLNKTGHETSKIEVIISGGTFNFYPRSYQRNFVRGVFNGLNFDFSSVRGVDKSGRGSGQANTTNAKVTDKDVVNGDKARSLTEAEFVNEKANHRCVGLSIETRPDYVKSDELKFFRELGVTKVEIGVQCLDDEIYRLNSRGHTVREVRDAMKLLKDFGFKINVHFMPNMYGSSLKKDFEMFKMLFEDPDFRPDWLKIYPCVVIPGTPLEVLYRAGKHKPYTDRQLVDLLVKFKEIVPHYCRITRLIRDIPAESIIGGSKVSNLRQVVQEEMKLLGKKCNCIRCREIKDSLFKASDVKLVTREYDSSDGKEYFLSFEDKKQDKLIGFLRLRIPSQHFSEERHPLKDLQDASVIREIHVFGEQVKVRGQMQKAGQHKGYGSRLVDEALEITKKYGLKKLAVISGVGVRDYYRKLGFKDGELYQVYYI